MPFKNYEEMEQKYAIGGSNDWLNLEEGPNKVRIVTDFIDYGVHQDERLKKSVICIGKDNCIYCQEGNKIRVQYLGWVIDRKSGELKLLRIGHKIYKQIGALANNQEYGFDVVPDYDITINRSGKGLETEYTVIADRKNTPLTDEELEKIEKAKSIKEIITAMKEKAVPEKIATQSTKLEEKEPVDGEDINVEDIPF